jgi:ketosteroid isomerase-like protein
MYELTKDALSEIQQVHSSWVECEIVGDSLSLMALCADEIEFWPPDAPPLRGRAAVSAQTASAKAKIDSIEITDRRFEVQTKLLT